MKQKVLLLLMLLSSLSGYAEEATVGVYRYSYNTSTKEATIIPNSSYNNLTEVDIPTHILIGEIDYDVIAIAENAFANCTNMKKLIISESIKEIAGGAFAGCSKIDTICCYAEEPVVLGKGSTASKVFDEAVKEKCVVFVTMGKVNQYLNSDGWKDFKNYREVYSSFKYHVMLLIDGMFFCVNVEKEEGMLIKAVPELMTSRTRAYYLDQPGIWSPTDIFLWTSGNITDFQTAESVGLGSKWIYYQQQEEEEEAAAKRGEYYRVSPPPPWSGMFMKTRGLSSDYQKDLNTYTPVNRIMTRSEGEEPHSFKLVGIGDKAFSDCSWLKEVSLPESVYYIGNMAFSGCQNLTSVHLPNSVTWLGFGAFSGCTSLNSITIPESVKSISAAVFDGCTGLSTVKFNASVDKVELGLFSGCTSLKSIDISNTVKSIGWRAFDGCSNLETINGAENVESIDFMAFENCYKLENIPVFNHLKEIKDRAFEGCVKLKKFTFPNTLKKIGDDAFSTCDLSESSFGEQMTLESIGEAAFISTKLSSFNIPNTVVSVGSLAFANCYDLKSVTLSSRMTSLGDKIFAECFSLETISIPANIKTIGKYIFEDCESLNSVVSYIAEPMEVESFTQYSSLNATLYVPTGTRRTYLKTEGWKNFPAIREGDGTWPENAIAFADCKNETVCVNSWDTNDDSYLSYEEAAAVETLNCRFPSSITSFDELQYFTSLKEIGKSAFSGCKDLTSMVIPESVTTIGNNAFFGCSGLTEIIVPEGVTIIGSEAFDGCTNLVSISIPSTVTSIGDYCFYGCNKLTKVNISDLAAWCNIDFGNDWAVNTNPLAIAHRFFINNEEVKDLVIPNGVTSIGYDAFDGCTGLTSVTIPNSVTAIGSDAFRDCTGVTSLDIRCDMSVLNKNLIDDFTNLKEVIFGCQTITSLFSKNTLIERITINHDVTSIGNSAFAECSGLNSLTIGNSVTSIGTYAFYGCDNMTKVNISDLAAWCNIKFGYSSNPLSYAHHLFLNGEEVTGLAIPDGVTSISGYAFNRCSSLTSVTIPNSVTSIGDYAFSGCSSLTSVTSHIKEPFAINYNTFNDVYDNATLYVPRGTYDQYDITSFWNSFKTITEIASDILGDANGDGMVNVADLIAIIRYLKYGASEGFNEKLADADGSGGVTKADVDAVVKIIMGIGK